jgi:hypothetical protein
MNRTQIPNFSVIREKYPELIPVLNAFQQGQASIADQTATNPLDTSSGAPPQVSGISVVEQGGIHDIQITDETPANRGIQYFLQYCQNPDFRNPHQISLGPSQNHRANLGAGAYYWRAYSSYGSSEPSEPLMHGGSTAAPVGSGTYPGPPMQATQGEMGFGPKYRSSPTPPTRS